MTITITLSIIAITAILSFLCFNNETLLKAFIFSPYSIKREKKYLKFLTHGFIHADYMHLLFNMITLFFFGPIVEQAFIYSSPKNGTILYIGFYLLAIIVAAIPSFFKHQNNQFYLSLGASGAVSAVLFASILLQPFMTINVYVIPVPALLFGPLYLFYSAYMAKRGKDNIGHDAHFVGAIFGMLALLLLIPGTFGRFVQQLLQMIQSL